ncbi:MAG: hypothetical protein V7K49_28275 [Nostoc sp.]
MERLRPKRSYAAGFTTPLLPWLRYNSWRGCANDAAQYKSAQVGYAQLLERLRQRCRSGQAQDKLSTSAQCPFP